MNEFEYIGVLLKMDRTGHYSANFVGLNGADKLDFVETITDKRQISKAVEHAQHGMARIQTRVGRGEFSFKPPKQLSLNFGEP